MMLEAEIFSYWHTSWSL